MTDLYKLGFSETNPGYVNRQILQCAADRGGDIILDTPGVYPLTDTVALPDHTSLYFGAGVYLKRAEDDGQMRGSLFINEGALRRTWNRDIKITGMKVINDDIAACAAEIPGKGVTGMRGILSFHYVKDLVIRDFETLDLAAPNFGIQVCTFENVLIENVHIEGRKDGIHFGNGRNFTVRHGVFRTYDDPIALNAHDYTSSNPQLGWIENGLIEDCYDLPDEDTVGYFARILAGSWLEWQEGMEIQNSDTVVSEGRIYRAQLPVDGPRIKSMTRPTHIGGVQYLDGIAWVNSQEGTFLNCGCRNIVFRDIRLMKKRSVALEIHFDKDNWSRSVYPYSVMPVQSNITFDNVVCDADIEYLLNCATPVRNVKILNSDVGNAKIRFSDIETEGCGYPEGDILISGCSLGDDFSIECDKTLKINTYWSANSGKEAEKSIVSDTIRFRK